MNTPLTKLKRIAILFAGISAASIPALAHADWSITKLLHLGSESSVRAFNDSGQVTGTRFEPYTDPRAFITGANGIGMTYFGFTSTSYGDDINNSGQVVGSFDMGDGYAFITGPNGAGMTNLGTLGGPFSHPRGVNDSGQVVGISSTDDYSYYGSFITDTNGANMTALGTVDGRTYSLAVDVNNSGQVVGNSVNAKFHDSHAFITGTNGAGMTELDDLGGGTSYATGINNSGQVVGWADAAVGYQAFVTDTNGTGITNLGTLGGDESKAVSINDFGQVIGHASAANGDDHAFIYSNGGMTDLSLLDVVVSAEWTYINLIDINNNGQILGYGYLNNGERETFLLSFTPDTVFTPQPIFIPSIPEPETYAMLLAGLGLIGFMARRRKKASM
jgi:probable HAF family extracellular repeat protein